MYFYRNIYKVLCMYIIKIMKILISLLLLVLSSLNLVYAVTCTINSRRLQSGELSGCVYNGGTTGCDGTNDVVLFDVTVPANGFPDNTGTGFVRCDNVDSGFDGSDTFFGLNGVVSNTK